MNFHAATNYFSPCFLSLWRCHVVRGIVFNFGVSLHVCSFGLAGPDQPCHGATSWHSVPCQEDQNSGGGGRCISSEVVKNGQVQPRQCVHRLSHSLIRSMADLVGTSATSILLYLFVPPLLEFLFFLPLFFPAIQSTQTFRGARACF